MKEINLIPPEARGDFADRWFRMQLLIRRMPVIAALVGGLFIIVSIWQVTATFRYRWMMANAEKTLVQARAQSAMITAESARVQEEKADILKEAGRMESKLLILEETKKAGVKWAPVLIRLSRLTPEQVWLNDISLNKDSITLKGSAFDNNSISAFMVALDKGGFKNTGFNYTQKVKLDDTGAINFEVITQLKR